MKYSIELKRISFSERLSQETNAFAADIWVDGVKAGNAENSGHGGNTNCSLHLLPVEKRREIEAYLKAQPPKVYPASGDMKEFSVPMDLEVVVDNLFEAWLAEKHSPENQEKKWIKTQVLFALKEDKPGVYRTLKFTKGRGKETYTTRHKDYLVKKYGDKVAVILNEKHGQVAI